MIPGINIIAFVYAYMNPLLTSEMDNIIWQWIVVSEDENVCGTKWWMDMMSKGK